MIPAEHKDAIISSGISFMRSITEAYGSDDGMKLWDAISSTLDPDVKGQIFFAMLVGDHRSEIYVKGLNAAALNNYVPVIKAIREITGWGLKEAKDCADQIRNNQVQAIPVNIAAERQRHINDLRHVGCVI